MSSFFSLKKVGKRREVRIKKFVPGGKIPQQRLWVSVYCFVPYVTHFPNIPHLLFISASKSHLHIVQVFFCVRLLPRANIVFICVSKSPPPYTFMTYLFLCLPVAPTIIRKALLLLPQLLNKRLTVGACSSNKHVYLTLQQRPALHIYCTKCSQSLGCTYRYSLNHVQTVSLSHRDLRSKLLLNLSGNFLLYLLQRITSLAGLHMGNRLLPNTTNPRLSLLLSFSFPHSLISLPFRRFVSWSSLNRGQPQPSPCSLTCFYSYLERAVCA